MFGSFGLPELLVVLFIILLLFGARKLPDLASGLGGAVNNFRKAMKGEKDEDAAPKTLEGRTTSNEPVPSAQPVAEEKKS